MSWRAWVLVGAVVLRLVSGPSSAACLSCCPTSSGPQATLSSLNCCDEGCGENVTRGDTRSRLSSTIRVAALWTDGILSPQGAEPGSAAVNRLSISPSTHPISPPTLRIAPLRL